MSITVSGVTRRFGNFTALDAVDLEVASGELVALLGPSGSGKSTLLRIIAGLDWADSGTISLNREDATHIPARERQVGFVFQHYALFRHMTIFENVAFGLRIKPRAARPAEAAIHERVRELLALVQLDGYGARYPHQLSGGQRQRVALARALAVSPRVLLLDEPFGALDARVRKELRSWLRQLHDELHITSVFVTHDQEEALEVADRVVVMNGGRIEQAGTPEAVYENPATPFVCGFLGSVNRFHGHLRRGWFHVGDAAFEAPQYGDADNAAAVAFVRPHELEVAAYLPGMPGNSAPGSGGFAATLQRIQVVGPAARLELTPLGAAGEKADRAQVIEAEMPAHRYRELNLKMGAHLLLKPRAVRIFLAG